MNNRIKESSKRLRPCSIIDDAPIPTEKGLAYTPAEMRQMAERGIPISTMMASETFFDGDYNDDTDVPIDFQRGIDAIDAWNAQQDARKRLSAAHRNDVANYGN